MPAVQEVVKLFSLERVQQTNDGPTPVPQCQEGILDVGETAPFERVQQQTAEQSVPQPREVIVEAVRSNPRERVQQRTAVQIVDARQFM